MRIQCCGLLVLVNSGAGGSMKDLAKRRVLLLTVWCSRLEGKIESVRNSSSRKVQNWTKPSLSLCRYKIMRLITIHIISIEIFRKTYLFGNDTELLCWEIVKRKNKSPVKVPFTIQWSIVNIRFLLIFFITRHPSENTEGCVWCLFAL